MSWQKLAEHRIEEAIGRGEFDDLPGRGQPLDLGEYFAQPVTERAGTQLLKNANVLPPEMELLKRITALEAALTSDGTPDERQRLQAELQEKRVTFALIMERRKKREQP
jgi:hypothetical protein